VGGLEYAREILETALGQRKAKEILEKIKQTIRTTGFNLLENVDPSRS
jgi:flagellar motor switch protein FliG